ncbi:cellulase family glycosylhydrolase [Sphingomonas sp. TDK1]|uniref:cellulase family glycosylhydrolase n=1 Tax=Sphingomonas sp. TDK1 TaxID=453247 RepID=UPI0007D905DA|nr:cellulase family glycosylhydrolase [Sphingomonas sp. TDK1]OAN66502.1 hypothetical protein A7X12_10200 [Sphingomonas sp. TDK1]
MIGAAAIGALAFQAASFSAQLSPDEAHAENMVAGATLRSLLSVQIVGNVPFDLQLATARKLGVGGVRMGMYWDRTEVRVGEYDWRQNDARVAAARGAGLWTILTLFGKAQGYVSADPTTRAPAGGDAQAGFARFAAAAAQRYGAGTAVAPVIYEIWNEPNTRTFWGGSGPDPEGYAGMATEVCEAIKAALSQATVSGLVMEGTPVKPAHFVPSYGMDIYQQWAGRAAEPRLMACLDAVSLHPYLNTPEAYLKDEPALERFFAEHPLRGRATRIINSEAGFAVNMAKGVAEDQQAALDLRTVLIYTARGRTTNLYQAVDTGSDRTNSELSFGLATTTGELKPAGAAIARLMQQIGDFEIVGITPLRDRPDLLMFTARRGGAHAYVLWSVASQAEAVDPRDLPAPVTRGIDLVSGRALALSAPLMVGASPVLLTNLDE